MRKPHSADDAVHIHLPVLRKYTQHEGRSNWRQRAYLRSNGNPGRLNDVATGAQVVQVPLITAFFCCFLVGEEEPEAGPELRVGILVVLAAVVVAVCFAWVFPAVAPLMPFNDITVD